MKTLKNLLLLLVIFVFIGCEKDTENTEAVEEEIEKEDNKEAEELIEENGLTYDINDFISQEILDILDSLKMPINKGSNPPQIEGEYMVSPLILCNTNRKNDEIGEKYSDTYLNFLNQDNKTLTIQVELRESQSSGSDACSYIVGDSTYFTVFSKIKNYREEKQDSSLSTRIYSGKISKAGIVDFHEALVMLDDYGDPNDHYIEVGDARIFYDSDSLSVREEEVKSLTMNSVYDLKGTDNE